MKTWFLRTVFGVLASVTMAGAAHAADADRDLAMKSLIILGAEVTGSTERCQSCHEMGVSTLNHWKDLTNTAQWFCFEDDLTISAMDRINCMRSDPTNVNSEFSPSKLGLYAAGAHLPSFKTMFTNAFPAAESVQQYEAFKRNVQMPFDGHNQVSQEDFDTVIEWAKRDMPYMEEIIGNAGEAPTTCTTEIKPAFLAHVQRMASEGWEAKNRDAGMQMFGCASGADTLNCLSMKDTTGLDLFPEASATTFGSVWAQDMPEAKIRVLRKLPFQTSYWMRSSADGRFVANGAYDSSDPDWTYGGRISDLQPQLTPGAAFRDIKVAATYDPGFFPDNSGFIFQGTPVSAGFCRLSVLEDPATAKIDFTQAGCSGASNISLYQAVGASLDGSDYLAITGSFAGDGGGGRTGGSGDGYTSWSASSYMRVVPIVNDGQAYKTLDDLEVYTPWLGDWGLSPSNLVAASRISGVDDQDNVKQMGYRFSFLDRQPSDAGYDVKLKNAGTICAKGGKGAFSFDERQFTTYHYVDETDFAELGYASADDAGFRALINAGTSNVYVLDLATGKTKRVTRMGPGQFAMFPHYRSDGWLYFLVYDSQTNTRYAVASDAAVRIARLNPIQ